MIQTKIESKAETSSITITPEAIKAISAILIRENDVLIKYRKNKGEIEIIEQRLSVKNHIKLNYRHIRLGIWNSHRD